MNTAFTTFRDQVWSRLVVNLAGLILLVASSATAAEPLMVHNVYFTLHDPSTKDAMIASCKKYLSKHDGEVFFAAGTLAEHRMLKSNDREFDVAVVIVFKSKDDLVKFDASERHKTFVAENRTNWKKIRVFDALADE